MYLFKKFLATLAAILSFTISAQAVNIEAGPIWNREHAKQRCPTVCQEKGMTWNGGWVTTIWGKMSVCSCDTPTTHPAAPPPEAVKEPDSKPAAQPESEPTQSESMPEPTADETKEEVIEPIPEKTPVSAISTVCPQLCKRKMGEKYTGILMDEAAAKKRVRHIIRIRSKTPGKGNFCLCRLQR